MDNELINEHVSGAETLEPDACAPESPSPSPESLLTFSSIMKELSKTRLELNVAKYSMKRLGFKLGQAEAEFNQARRTATTLKEECEAAVIDQDELKKAQDELKEADYQVDVVLIESMRADRLVREASEKLTRLKEAKASLAEDKDMLGEASTRESMLLWELDMDLKSGEEMKVEIVLDKRRGEASSSHSEDLPIKKRKFV